MENLLLETDPRVPVKFSQYPEHIRPKLEHLRSLIIEAAAEVEGIGVVTETLKWGEISYLVKKGSTIRIDWKEKLPKQYAMYFKCTSKLVPAFRAKYGDVFSFENNRAILFQLADPVPAEHIKDCIQMALRYHIIKDSL